MFSHSEFESYGVHLICLKHSNDCKITCAEVIRFAKGKIANAAMESVSR